MHPLKMLGFALLIAAPACAEPTVPEDQIVLYLKSVDGEDLPVTVAAGQNTKAHILLGVLAGSPSHSKCDYVLRILIGTAVGDTKGSIYQCSFKEGESLTVKIDLGGPPGPVGTHEYFFQY
jgi:hypothetical protein